MGRSAHCCVSQFLYLHLGTTAPANAGLRTKEGAQKVVGKFLVLGLEPGFPL